MITAAHIGAIAARRRATVSPFLVLDIPFDGPDGSTAIVDTRGHSLTVNGAVAISTAQFVDGGSSGYFPGNNASYLSVSSAGSVDFNFASGDFSIKNKLRLANTSGLKVLVTNRSTSGADAGFIFFINGAALQFIGYSAGGVLSVNLSGGTISANTWAATEIRRVGNLFSLIIDGSTVNSATISAILAPSTDSMSIGRDSVVAGRAMNGYMDALQIFKGGIA